MECNHQNPEFKCRHNLWLRKGHGKASGNGNAKNKHKPPVDKAELARRKEANARSQRIQQSRVLVMDGQTGKTRWERNC